MRTKYFYYGLFLLFITISSCSSSKKLKEGFNLFSLQDDQDLGLMVISQIDNNPNEYPVLDSAEYPVPYKYLYDIRNKILNTGKVKYKDDFPWRLRIIRDDATLNAFCTPGGYIYVYTGLIKFLDGEDELAGVLAHEIGHADYRHSTSQLTKLYGIQAVMDVLTADMHDIKNLTSGVLGLKFSRGHETQADLASVTYLCNTDYNAAGAAKFFEKIEAQGGNRVPQWLSTHPSPKNRVEFYYNNVISQGCSGTQTYRERYQKLKNSLP